MRFPWITMKKYSAGGWTGAIRNVCYMAVFLAAATAIGQLFHSRQMQETNIVLVYIVAVFLTARFSDRVVWGILASVVATFLFNFFFTEPLYTFSVYNSSYLITFVCMTATAIFTSSLTMKANRYARRAREKEREIHALYEFTSELSSADTMDSICRIAGEAIGRMLGREAGVRAVRSHGDCCMDEKTGSVESDSEWLFIRGREEVLGILELPAEGELYLDSERRTLLNTMLENIGIAMDRVCTSEERHRNQKLMEQEKYRANLLRGISHDLRTPLMGIMGTAQMIDEMSVEQDPKKRLAQDIYQDADWLYSLVENILGLTRLSDGSQLLVKLPEPLEEIISSAIKRVEKRAQGYDIGAELPEEYIEVPADARLLEQVFVNLLDNAIKHTPPQREIKIVARREEADWVQIEVLDRGEGISPGDLENIFEMFYTSAERAADIKKGIGLGLAICSTVIRAHGGSITAANREGGGAAFTIRLPLAGKGDSDVERDGFNCRG